MKLLKLCILAVLFATTLAYAAKPKVRAITAFVRIDRAHYKTQLGDALKMLRSAKSQYESAGYEVQTIRITTQPFPEYTRGLSADAALAFFRDLDAFSKQEKFLPNIGPVTMSDDVSNFNLLGVILANNDNLESSAIIADDHGIHWSAVRASAKLVKYLEDNSPRSQGNFNFAATAFLPAYAPFFPGSWHNGPGRKFAVGLESANVVDDVFSETGYDPAVASTKLKAALAKEAIAADAIAQRVAKSSGWEYLGLDPTPAPLKDVSIGAAIEKFLAPKVANTSDSATPSVSSGSSGTSGTFGSSGTMTAAFIITDAVKSVPVKQVGYAGLMLPVLEDSRIAQRWGEGTISLHALLAYSSVCGTGLDTIPLPGDVTEDQLARIIGDVATLAFKWKKPLTARLQPVKGRNVGELSNFEDPYMVNTVLQKLP
ncbi:MAG: hypothetical protein JWO13_661 [Acidobacteriales bacterium]|nr:hypothetical protein [Terriglobales bacterium]